MTDTRITAAGAREVALGFDRAQVKSAATVRAIVRKYGALLNTRIKAKASGRPGPNAPTGDYRRSWTTRYYDLGSTSSALTGTNAPQGQRLENGFIGVDSLGRTYDQPPFPHVGPAVEEIVPDFLRELGEDGAGL